MDMCLEKQESEQYFRQVRCFMGLGRQKSQRLGTPSMRGRLAGRSSSSERSLSQFEKKQECEQNWELPL
jgi:hypothetical protein